MRSVDATKRGLSKAFVVPFPVCIVGMFVALLFMEFEGGNSVGPAWAIALFVLSTFVSGLVTAVAARATRQLLFAVMSVSQLFGGFAIAVPHADVDRPWWIASIALTMLVVLVVGAVPLVITIWRSQRDERERAIFGIATSIAFGVVMLVGAVFALLGSEHVSTLDVPTLTPMWIVGIGIATWLGSMFVLTRRM